MTKSRTAVACVFAAGLALTGSPAAAECTNMFCELMNKVAPPLPALPSLEPAAAEPAEPSKPVQWGSPVDIRPAAQSETKPVRRTAKRDSAEAPAASKPRKKKPESTAKAAPAQVKPAAAGAYALDYASLVRVVPPEDVNEIDLAAPEGVVEADPPAPESTEDPAAAQVQVVEAAELNGLDRQASDAAAAAQDTQTQDVAAAPPEPETKSWMERVRGVFGSAMSMVSAAMRSLFG